MKKYIYFLLIGTPLFAQVGINTINPNISLDITGKGLVTSADGVIAPRLSKQQLANKTSGTYAAAQTGAIVYVNNSTAPTGTPPSISQVAEINTEGYYYFNGSLWKKVGDIAINNLYTNDGTLGGNRVVTQAGNTLAFRGTATNAFSVDGNTFSVDAANHRVGIGNTTPSSFMSILTSTAGATIDALSVGINNCGAACGQGTARNITLFNANGTNPLFGGIDFIPSSSATGLSGAGIYGIDRDGANNYAGLQFFTRNATNYAARVTIKSSGNIGIGTETPTVPLHVVSGANSGEIFKAQNNAVSTALFLGPGNNGAAVGGWIGTTSNHNFYLMANNIGTLEANPSTLVIRPMNGYTITTTSDRRMKKDIQPIVIDHINFKGIEALTPVQYKKIDNATGRLEFGFIAQDLEKIYPNLVFTDEKGYKSVNYTGLIPILTAELKNQKAEIEELKAMIKTLMKN